MREGTENGDYLFVDNHYVYNAPDYVQEGAGGLELTPYALTHMDECCLVFEMKISSGACYGEYHTICYLNRDNPGYTFEIKYHGGLENNFRGGQEEFRKREMEEAKQIRLQMTENPTQCMELIFGWKKKTYKELGKEIGRDSKTIGRIVKGKTTPELKTLVLICLGLNLHPVISERLIELFGYKFIAMDDEHLWMREALHIKYPEPVHASLKYLRDMGVDI